MAAPIDDCWRLLRSLDPAEKAYVKRLAWKDGARSGAYPRLRDELLPLREDPFERQAFDSFDYPLWLEARIHGWSLREAAERAEAQ